MTAQPAGDTHTPDQWHHHLRELEAIHHRWEACTITTDTKRQLIAQENARYHGPGHKSRATGADITTTSRRPA
jgi:hypothetical protein